MVLTTLSHHIDLSFLKEAHRLTRKDGAVGADGITAEEYAQNLEENLASLLERFKAGTYKAKAAKRAYIPKGDGSKQRPIAIASFEDKVLQRAVTMILEAVYEQDFLPSSYGFRPGKSPHQAVQALWDGIMRLRGGYVLEVDIQSFFDELDQTKLRAILDKRVRDGIIRRTIDKWLKAGVLDNGKLSYPERGSPQGSVVSPILSNIYLHEVTDVWFENTVKPRMKGEALMIRFADDLRFVFSQKEDALRVLKVLPKRFGKYGLRLHPGKTRLVQFNRPPRGDRRKMNQELRPETFDFLGFTHYWGKSRRGNWIVKRKTARSRVRRALRELKAWCREHRNFKVPQQHKQLRAKLLGHYAYYGITGNLRSLQVFRLRATEIWLKWLRRRSQKGKRLNWEKFQRLLDRYPLPAARIVHKYASS